MMRRCVLQGTAVRAVLQGTALCAALGGICGDAAAQAAYATPQAAADALVTAMSTGDEAGLRKVLGPDFRRFVPQDSVDREDIYAFLGAWYTHHEIVGTSPTTARFVVGRHDWSFPAPLVKAGARWHFDLHAGIKEMRRRRIDRNEDAAMATLQALCTAQERYRAAMGKPATRIISREGRFDGLYWDEGTPGAPGPSPLGEEALAMGADTPADAALHGYHFAVLPPVGQTGCSFRAWPAAYGISGRDSFTIGADKQVQERDAAMTAAPAR